MGKSCRKFLWENLVGNGGGEKANLRKAVIGGNLAFGIGLPTNEDAQEGNLVGNLENLAGNLVGKSCRKFLWENLVGNGGGEKFLPI